MHVIVHSGQHFNDNSYLNKTLDRIHSQNEITRIAGLGNTQMKVIQWAEKNNIPVENVKPDYYLCMRGTPFEFLCKVIGSKKPFKIAEGDHNYNAKVKEDQEYHDSRNKK